MKFLTFYLLTTINFKIKLANKYDPVVNSMQWSIIIWYTRQSKSDSNRLKLRNKPTRKVSKRPKTKG